MGREPGDQLAHDGVGLVNRREVDRLARLREGPDRGSGSDSLIGRVPDVSGRRQGPGPHEVVAAGTKREDDQDNDRVDPSLPTGFRFERSLPLIEPEVIEIGHKGSLHLRFRRLKGLGGRGLRLLVGSLDWGGRPKKESRPGTASWEPSRLGLGGEADTHTNDGFDRTEQTKYRGRIEPRPLGWVQRSAIIWDMRFCSAIFCLLAMTACSDKSPSTPSPVSREVVLAPGQTAAVAEAGLTLAVRRCLGRFPVPGGRDLHPAAGTRSVRIAVIPTRGGERAYALHTGDMRPVAHDDVTIALVELSPYPFSTRPIQPADYRATLRSQPARPGTLKVECPRGLSRLSVPELSYSSRRATIGSRRAARSAGTPQAMAAMSRNPSAIAPNVAGSVGSTPTSMRLDDVREDRAPRRPRRRGRRRSA